MLETHEGYAARVDDELTGIRGAHPDHQNDVVVGVRLEQLATARFRIAHEGNDIGALQHRTEIAAVCKHSRPHDVREVRAVRVDNVVVPVRLK